MVDLLPIDHDPFVPAEINRTYDVPYLAGVSTNGQTLYIDRRVPEMLEVKRLGGERGLLDPARPLGVHELVEWTAMTRHGLGYEDAHESVATPAERAWVEGHGFDWGNYEAIMDGLLAHIEHEPIKSPPPDLYTKPYPHHKAEIIKRLEATK